MTLKLIKFNDCYIPTKYKVVWNPDPPLPNSVSLGKSLRLTQVLISLFIEQE